MNLSGIGGGGGGPTGPLGAGRTTGSVARAAGGGGFGRNRNKLRSFSPGFGRSASRFRRCTSGAVAAGAAPPARAVRPAVLDGETAPPDVTPTDMTARYSTTARTTRTAPSAICF